MVYFFVFDDTVDLSRGNPGRYYEESSNIKLPAFSFFIAQSET